MDKIVSKRFNKKDYACPMPKNEEEIKALCERVQNLSFKNAILRYEIENADLWSNEVCMGYAIKAYENLDLDFNDVETLVNLMRKLFDEWTLEQAREYYFNSLY